MNSLLSGLSKMAAATGATGGMQGPSMLLQALGAAMRGESASDFMKTLANSHPQLKQYDLNNLSATAQQVCQNNGVNPDAVTQQIDNVISPYVK